MVIHDIECPYRDQVLLNNINQNKEIDALVVVTSGCTVILPCIHIVCVYPSPCCVYHTFVDDILIQLGNQYHKYTVFWRKWVKVNEKTLDP